MESQKPIATQEQMRTFAALAEKELKDNFSVSVGADKLYWYTLLVNAIASLSGTDLTHEEFFATRKVIEHFIQGVFRHSMGCRWTLHDHLDKAQALLSEAQCQRRLADSCWIETYSGVQFYPLEPRVQDIRIEDIAHALSNQCRFGGHTGWFYSVAQHSVLVSRVCPPRCALEGLLHDAAEAYLIDLPRPIKHLPEMRAYRDAEARLEMALAERFALRYPWPDGIDGADITLLTTESRDLLQFLPPDWKYQLVNGYPVLPDKIVPLDSVDAEQLFLDEFDRLMEERGGTAAERGGE